MDLEGIILQFVDVTINVMCWGEDMDMIKAILLGIIQGLTEFLPISSSGHLVIFQNVLGLKEPELLLDCSLHLGTLLAVCIYFRSDLRKMANEFRRREFGGPSASLALRVLVGSVPTAIIGLVFKSFFERLYGSIASVGLLLVVTGGILIVTGLVLGATKLLPRGYGSRMQVGFRVALVIGAAQGLAIMPGISRSGITIACGLLCGLDRELAGRFSFLLSIPAIVGAVMLQFNIEEIARIGPIPLLVGFGSADLVGFFSLKLLMGMVKKGRLHYFTPYCWIVGAIVILAHLF